MLVCGNPMDLAQAQGQGWAAFPVGGLGHAGGAMTRSAKSDPATLELLLCDPPRGLPWVAKRLGTSLCRFVAPRYSTLYPVRRQTRRNPPRRQRDEFSLNLAAWQSLIQDFVAHLPVVDWNVQPRLPFTRRIALSHEFAFSVQTWKCCNI